MDQSSDFVELKVPAKPEYVGIVRLTVSGIANRLGYSYDEIEDIKIAVAEACTNVVNHAYSETAINPKMLITCNIYTDRMEIAVADKGGQVDVEAFKNEKGPINSNESIEKLKEGGLGLFLIETLMDKVEISAKAGVVIVMTKFLQRGEVEQGVDSISKELPKQ